jgi:hypothetical protein
MKAGRGLVCAVAMSLCASTAGAEPSIAHVGLECIEPGTFAAVLSGIDPEREIQTAKVYFRSSLYPDFYYVEMTFEGDRFVGVLPQASPETPQVIYYVEAVDSIFESARSPEFDPVVEDCDDDPAAAYLSGREPSIVVGATRAGASAIPPGFSAAGIVGTITAAGLSSGIGGGVGAGTAIAAGAAAAGVAGAVVVSNQPETTSSVTAAPPATVTSSVPSGGGPSSTSSVSTTTAPPGATTTVATTTVGTTTIPGPSTTTTPASTSSSSTTTSAAPALNPECFTVQVLGDCKVKLDATCVNPPVDRYDWVLDTQDTFQRVTISNGGPTVIHTWSDDCDEDGGSLRFRLTVYRGGSSASAEKTVFVPGNDLKAEAAISHEVRIEIRLELPQASGGERAGRVILDGQLLAAVAAGEPLSVRTSLARGTHEVEAILARAKGMPGVWSFDFRDTASLEAGTLTPVEGSVVVLGPRAVAFRLSGQPGDRFRFRFTLDN